MNGGIKKIAYCTGGLFDEEGKGKDRNQGFQKALSEAGIKINPKWIFIDQHTIEDGKHVLRQILEMEDRPTAIFTGSDQVAGGIILEAKDHGLTIPDDLAVIGFDDQPIAEIVNPKLTTIRQPVDLMGEQSINIMIQMLENPEMEIRNYELPIELVVRQST
ncbi:LacI family DNA-binding transcriptional regulator [Bacillus sp. m3-13]|uniref:LacI family DNA-binding transcriptional regulator n=1 Tax=Bacillus sp. m3-13 TaxID=406124 RepID=UPI000319BD33